MDPWIKTKFPELRPKKQAFGDIPDATTESITIGGENAEITQTFTNNFSASFTERLLAAIKKSIDGKDEPVG